MIFGCGTSTSNRWAVAATNTDNAANGAFGTRSSVAAIGVTGGATGALDIDSVSGDTITFIVDTQQSGAGIASWRVRILALGGSDITNQTCVSFAEADAEVDEIGFQATGIIAVTVGTATDTSTSTNGGNYSVGAYDGTNQWVCAFGGEHASDNPILVGSYCLGGELIAISTAPSGAGTGYATDALASATAFDSNGVDLSWAESAATRRVFVGAWAGGQFDVNEGVTAADTNAFNSAAVGFTPSVVFVASASQAEHATNTPAGDQGMSLGAANGTTQSAASSMGRAGVNTSDTGACVQVDDIYCNLSTASAVEGLMSVTSFADPIQFTMDDADPSAFFFGWAAWGATAAGGGGGSGHAVVIGGGIF
jgi:hypothetical protein